MACNSAGVECFLAGRLQRFKGCFESSFAVVHIQGLVFGLNSMHHTISGEKKLIVKATRTVLQREKMMTGLED